MRSIEPTDVPPNFWTTKPTGVTGWERLAATGFAVNAVTWRPVSPYAGYLIETFVTLIAVCALAVLLLWGARRVGVGRPSGPIELCGRLQLDARRAIYLVKVGAQVYVLGVGEGGFTKLGEMPSSDLPSDPHPAAPGSFADALARAWKGGKDP
jgi:flagellar biogenesis protein FliO